MIPMACPDCGRRGVVPPDRLLSRLHCKNCGTTFHLDAAGHVGRGDPPGTAAFDYNPPSPATTRPAADPLVVWDRLVVGTKVVAIVALVGLSLSLLGLAPLPWKGLSPDLVDRGQFVTKAFLDNDLGALRRITLPGTEDDVKQWLDHVRPTYKAPPGELLTFVSVMNDQGGTAHVMVNMVGTGVQIRPELEAKPHNPVGPQPSGTFDLPLVWIRTPAGRWLLDGAQTLQTLTEPSHSMPMRTTQPHTAATHSSPRAS